MKKKRLNRVRGAVTPPATPKRLALSFPKGTMIMLGQPGRGRTYAVPSSVPLNTYRNILGGGRISGLVNGQEETGRVQFTPEKLDIMPALRRQLLERFPNLDPDNLSA